MVNILNVKNPYGLILDGTFIIPGITLSTLAQKGLKIWLACYYFMKDGGGTRYVNVSSYDSGPGVHVYTKRDQRRIVRSSSRDTSSF